jgi:hypothetical protein
MSLSPLVFSQTCHVQAVTSTDRYGAETVGAAVAVRCQSEEIMTRVVSAAGAIVQHTTKVYMPADTVIDIGDRITLPNETSPRPVAHVSRPPDLRGQVAFCEATLA